MIGGARRADGGVVVTGPALGRDLGRGDQPADAQSREAVCLGQAAHADHLVVASPETRRGFPVQLSARVHLVGEQPGAHFAAALEDHAARVVGEDVARRVVGVGDDHELRARRDGGADLLGERLPAVAGVQVEPADLGAEVLGLAPDLEVAGEQHRDLVARLQQTPAGDEVRFGAAGGDEHVVGRGAGVERGDALAQQVGAVGLAVAEPHLKQRDGGGAGEAEQLLDGEGVDAGLRQVEADPVLPRALPTFQLERDEPQLALLEDAVSRQPSAVSKVRSSGRSSQ